MPDAPATTKTDLPPLPDRVLIVEDDAIIGLALEDALAGAGVRNVEISTTTEQALDALRRERPEAIVLDVHLADRDDGWAIAELARSLGPSGPRIVFSTGAPQDIPEEIAEIGCILEKPYDPQDLIRILAEPKRRGLISRLRAVLR
jgi:CheY-like chemotaxis protein